MGSGFYTVAQSSSGPEVILGAQEEPADGWHWLTTSQRKEMLLAKVRLENAACEGGGGRHMPPNPRQRPGPPATARGAVSPHPYLSRTETLKQKEAPTDHARSAAWDCALRPEARKQALLYERRRGVMQAHQVSYALPLTQRIPGRRPSRILIGCACLRSWSRQKELHCIGEGCIYSVNR